MFDTQNLTAGKVALIIEYDGAEFFGWQRQSKPPVPTVQQAVEDALSKVANHEITVFCAGRTDARVHASAQVVHFETSACRSPKAWVCGVNANLPDSIVVRHAQQVAEDFHARHSALARSYRYIIANTPVRSANFAKKVTFEPTPLDTEKMHQGAQCLLGEHDFSSFRGAACQSKSPFRFVEHVQVVRRGDLVIIEIKANAFVLHMVRNIAGVLMDVGLGKQPVSYVESLLKLKDRQQGSKTAPPFGLYFVAAHYPKECNIRTLAPGPLFLPNSL